ncbi:MAG: hypothetical protein WCY75_00435 [Sulfurimonadaceae bacterium]|jgi:hypothetical protein|nr:hypothetical protein [Arcobacteraceae bacterium]
MEKIEAVHVLKLNFLEVWKNISEEETQSLITFTNTDVIENKIKNYCTDTFPLEKVILTFHAYASIAYLSAELIVNAKIFLDIKKEKYILLARKIIDNTLMFCVVYSNIKELSQYPALGISVDNMIEFLESNTSIEQLKKYYSSHPK